MTKDEFSELSGSIENEEVPSVLFSALEKVHMHMELKTDSMDEELNLKYNIFKIFFVQYNTVLTLSKRTKLMNDRTSEKGVGPSMGAVNRAGL